MEGRPPGEVEVGVIRSSSGVYCDEREGAVILQNVSTGGHTPRVGA